MIPWNGLADRLLLHPSRKAIPCAVATRHEIPTPAGALEVWVSRSAAACRPQWQPHAEHAEPADPAEPAESAEPTAFVLAFCGNGSRAERETNRALAIWQRHPVEIWAVNYPGYGGSAGRASLSAIPDAALAAYDAAAARASGRPIFVAGCSLGTAACLCVAARRDVAGVVLHNPPPLRELIAGHHAWWNLGLLARPVARRVPEALDSLANARRSAAPAVFILAGRDLTVPPAYQRMVVDAYAGPKQVLEYPGHRHNTPVRGEDLDRLHPRIERIYTGAAEVAPGATGKCTHLPVR